MIAELYAGWTCDFCNAWYPENSPDAPPTVIRRTVGSGQYTLLRCEACVTERRGGCDSCLDPDATGQYEVEEGKYECCSCYTGRIEG